MCQAWSETVNLPEQSACKVGEILGISVKLNLKRLVERFRQLADGNPQARYALAVGLGGAKSTCLFVQYFA